MTTNGRSQVIKQLIELSKLKLSSAQLQQLEDGKCVSLDNHKLSELGSLYTSAEAYRTNAKEGILIKNAITEKSHVPTPTLKIACASLGSVTCCLHLHFFPPGVEVRCEGSF